MAKNFINGMLLDFYGSLLSERQRDVMELYYNEDLSLAEIAEDIGITRQGVRDAIKKSESILAETEEKLGLAQRFKDISQKLDILKRMVLEIDVDKKETEPIIKLISELEI